MNRESFINRVDQLIQYATDHGGGKQSLSAAGREWVGERFDEFEVDHPDAHDIANQVMGMHPTRLLEDEWENW